MGQPPDSWIHDRSILSGEPARSSAACIGTASARWGLPADTTFTVTLEKGRQIAARAGEPLMNSLERQGIALPAQCRTGECSLCRTRLVSGQVYQPPGAKLRKSDRRFGYIHPCLAYPITDVEPGVRTQSDACAARSRRVLTATADLLG
jgi:ferredoxin